MLLLVVILQLLAILGLILSLGEREHWKTLVVLFAIGFVFRAAEVFIIKDLPQMRNPNPDSVMYDAQARAFVNHWQGHAVPASEYGLSGLAQVSSEWLPTDSRPYGAVVGARHFLYQIYVGVLYLVTGRNLAAVVLSQATFLAALSPIAYGLAITIFGSKRVATIAAALVTLDPSFAVVGAALLKDGIVTFLSSVGLWTVLLLGSNRKQPIYPLALFSIVLVALSISRYHVVISFGFAAFLTMLLTSFHYRRVNLRLSLIVLIAFVGAALAYNPNAWRGGLTSIARTDWVTINAGLKSLQISSAMPARPFDPGVPTNMPKPSGGTASTGAKRVAPKSMQGDQTVANWLSSLRHRPYFAALKSIAHTLFAPYPWVPLFYGMTYKSFSELFYPGVVLWILGLPFLAIAIGRLQLKRNPILLLVMLWVLTIMLVYILFQGEFSTRQRVFLMPFFWVLIASGMNHASMTFVHKRKEVPV